MNSTIVIIGSEHTFWGRKIYTDSSSVSLPVVAEVYVSGGDLFVEPQIINLAHTGQIAQPDSFANSSSASKDTLYGTGDDNFLRYKVGTATSYEAFTTAASLSPENIIAPVIYVARLLQSEGTRVIVMSDSNPTKVNSVLAKFNLWIEVDEENGFNPYC